MKTQILPISLSLLFFPLHYTGNGDTSVMTHTSISAATENETFYNELHLGEMGLSKKAFDYAWKGYQYLTKKERLGNSSVLSICDLSQSSNKKRFYILDISSRKVVMTDYVAHGRGSGMEYATRFSNRASSHQSSLGFYVTGQTYYGEHGLSLRLEGLEAGFNDHAARRSIVVHGADYVGDEHLQENKFMGRSYGCPAVPEIDCRKIIDLIKDGSCLFIYHPTKNYIQKSRILNG